MTTPTSFKNYKFGNFRKGFIFENFRENKILAKWRNNCLILIYFKHLLRYSRKQNSRENFRIYSTVETLIMLQTGLKLGVANKNSFLISQKPLYYNVGNILDDIIPSGCDQSSIRLINTFSTIRILHAHVKP